MNIYRWLGLKKRAAVYVCLKAEIPSYLIMSPSEIDYFAFAQLLLSWLAALFVGYVVLVLLLRVSNYYRLRRCPNCKGELKRSQRSGSDRLVTVLTLGIIPLKRYRCYTCYWEGRALEITKNTKGRSRSEEID
jgi:hypothetical protein